MSDINILWVDDEIDLLKPHIIFLEQKGYRVAPCNNGIDALELCKQQVFDMVFLDENMPGISGLQVLVSIKSKQPNLPVVMITKNEEEHIMEEAIGSKIADYLIKPVHPKQLLSCLKRNLDHSRLVSEKTAADYRQAFGKIALDLGRVNTYQGWIDLYKALIFWEIELENINDTGMLEILESQKQEANTLFFKYIKKHYRSWINGEEAPLLSNTLLKKFVLPEVQKAKEAGTLLLVIDNLRYDQFIVLEQVLNTFYKKVQEMAYYSILPTTTQYARNALFSGLMPLEIEQLHPEYWKNDTEEGGKNLHEEYLLNAQLKRHGYELNTAYHKITNIKKGRWLSDHFNSIAKNDLTVIVYNFVDMLSH
ncbi:MAG: response regulator, partial [Lutibacter sp.]|nr:response regulator [Lutibacter sp.]